MVGGGSRGTGWNYKRKKKDRIRETCIPFAASCSSRPPGSFVGGLVIGT